jgi:hypothetical protein
LIRVGAEQPDEKDRKEAGDYHGPVPERRLRFHL